MTDWYLEHPWLTFWLVVLFLLLIDAIITNHYRYKHAKLTHGKPKLNKEEIIEQYKNSSNENFYEEN